MRGKNPINIKPDAILKTKLIFKKEHAYYENNLLLIYKDRFT